MNNKISKKETPIVNWSDIIEASNYQISDTFRIRNKTTGCLLIIRKNKYVTCRVDGQNKVFNVEVLTKKYHNVDNNLLEEGEEWRAIHNFQKHEVSSLGRIRHKYRRFIRELNKKDLYGYTIVELNNKDVYKIKTKAFCEWYYNPDNIGGIIAKRRLTNLF